MTRHRYATLPHLLICQSCCWSLRLQGSLWIVLHLFHTSQPYPWKYSIKDGKKIAVMLSMLSSFQCIRQTYSVFYLRQVYVQSNKAQHTPQAARGQVFNKTLEACSFPHSDDYSLIFHFLLCSCALGQKKMASHYLTV